MGLLTRKQLEEVREEEVKLDLKVVKPKPIPEVPYRVRMHHPDTSANYPLRNFTLKLDGEEFLVEGGVVTVDSKIAAKLEAMGWRTGKRLEAIL